jgi:hypothetical protein
MPLSVITPSGSRNRASSGPSSRPSNGMAHTAARAGTQHQYITFEDRITLDCQFASSVGKRSFFDLIFEYYSTL